MGGKAKGKHRLDKFYHLAKEHGYRSRAVWKLIQLDSKFSFLRSSHAVLDLCAAPGGWMQAAVERVPVGSLVIGVDLDPIRPIRGAIAIREDITTPKCRATVKRLMSEHGVKAFDLVLHDGSPNIGGAWDQEATNQNALVIDSVKLAAELLAPKGTFVTKVFRSRDYNAVLYCLKQLFEKVDMDKPAASRSSSAETFIVCQKYKAPAKIDPRLFDIRHLFQGGKEPGKVIDINRPITQKRHRDGYEDGVTLLRKTCSASEFIWSNAPLDVLGTVTSITFKDETSLPIKNHSLTTDEVKELCDDLRVLGKQDFKQLLKWRILVRKAFSPEKETPKPADVEPESKVNEDEDEDDDGLKEMEELTNAMLRKKKQEKKNDAKRRAKDKARKKTGMQSDVMEDGYTDIELFALSSIKGKKDLVAVDNTEDDDGAENEAMNSDNEGDQVDSEDKSVSDMDSDEERRRYDEKMEQLMEEAYEQYVSKKEGSTKLRKRMKQKHSEDGELLEGGDDDADDALHMDEDSDNDQESNPLMVPLNDHEHTKEEIDAIWYSKEEFNYDNDRQGNSKSDDEDEMHVETKAEILACAKKMLRKKQREQMLDDAYNKYMFHDDEGLPKWFIDEERKHMQPMKPITKEEVNAMKAQFKEINARPAKKVAQAKARKKRVAIRKMEKVRKKANTIADQEDINDRSKMKMINTLYKKAIPQRPKKELVVAKKGVQVRTGKGKVLVDRRMKKDARKHGMKKDKEKGKSKGGKGQKGKGSKGKMGKGEGPKGKMGRK
ncbi:putative 27S pre-rRNA (guanosine(2922)-2'-O)-methyltransferase [Helianthus annuus]|nr:putative 27S pre-rRNA (guanosine(2922)-2'-O)-methyltransferase [Helianthus annuus]KAJ0675398.1 putative 27S pre-rRNA (guanosine(2922)-2'-O)-methyltransferase [Helianthus annuus]